MELLEKTFEDVEIGEPRSCSGLTMVPLMRDQRGEPDHATLDEALAEGWFRVSEVSTGGSVPELKVVNEGDRSVLMIDGEELVGAKQNRVLNLTILVPAGRTLIVPVSCVEQGRWSYSSRTFASSPQFMHAIGRAMKTAQVSGSLRGSGRRHADQGALWDEIERKAHRLRVSSPSAALADVFDDYRDKLEDYADRLAWSEGQSGAVFAVGGRVVGLDLFAHASTMRRLLSKIVRSYALDAVETARDESPAPSREAVEGFVGDVRASRLQSFPAIGLGSDLRLSGPGVAGGGLALDDALIHLSAFRIAEGQQSDESPGSRARAELRRRFSSRA